MRSIHAHRIVRLPRASTGGVQGFRRWVKVSTLLGSFLSSLEHMAVRQTIKERPTRKSLKRGLGWADVEGRAMLNHAIAHDPAARAPGQHARAIVTRLRLRTLVALGVLAVATALLGRTFGVRDIGFLGSEIGLLAAMFVVLRYVLPLVDRHDRGATGEEQVDGLRDGVGTGWHAIHDASLGNGNVDHILIGPAGVYTVETKSNPGPVRVARVHGSTLPQAQAQRRAI